MEDRVRRGGIQTPEGFLFELTGGNPALDFANTVDLRPTAEAKDLIPTFADLCSWAQQAGVLTREQALALLKKGKREPGKAEQTRKQAIALRELMFQIFSRAAAGQNVPKDLFLQWNRFVQRSMRQYKIVQTKEGFSWKLDSIVSDMESILWLITHAAVELLTGANVMRIRRCASDKCDWLFLDTSKRGNRRWCDMTVCGNRAKASRFYSRKKALQQTTQSANLRT